MIHDLDVVLSLVRSPIKKLRAVGLADPFSQGGHLQCAHGIRKRLRSHFTGQPVSTSGCATRFF